MVKVSLEIGQITSTPNQSLDSEGLIDKNIEITAVNIGFEYFDNKTFDFAGSQYQSERIANSIKLKDDIIFSSHQTAEQQGATNKNEKLL